MTKPGPEDMEVVEIDAIDFGDWERNMATSEVPAAGLAALVRQTAAVPVPVVERVPSRTSTNIASTTARPSETPIPASRARRVQRADAPASTEHTPAEVPTHEPRAARSRLPVRTLVLAGGAIAAVGIVVIVVIVVAGSSSESRATEAVAVASTPAAPTAAAAAPEPVAKHAASDPVATHAAPEPVAKQAAPDPVATRTASDRVATQAAPDPIAKPAASPAPTTPPPPRVAAPPARVPPPRVAPKPAIATPAPKAVAPKKSTHHPATAVHHAHASKKRVAARPTPPPAVAPVEPDVLDQAHAAYNTGNESLFAGESDAAILAYQQVLVFSPTLAFGYRGLGLAYAQKGDHAAAIKALRQYLELAPRAKDAPLIRKRISGLQAAQHR